MTEEKRDCKVYYVACPEDADHFILEDSADPMWEKTPPISPLTVECRGCGEHHRVKVTQPWNTGYVSSEERDKLCTRCEPETIPLAGRRVTG